MKPNFGHYPSFDTVISLRCKIVSVMKYVIAFQDYLWISFVLYYLKNLSEK